MRQRNGIGKIISLARYSIGFSLDDLALASGLGRSTIWRIELGLRTPLAEELQKIAKAIDSPALSEAIEEWLKDR